MEKRLSLSPLIFMSVTKRMCFNPLRALKPLNYISPLIRFFKPLNPLNSYGINFYRSTVEIFFCKCCYASTRTHSQEKGDLRQKTRDRQEKWDRRRETGSLTSLHNIVKWFYGHLWASIMKKDIYCTEKRQRSSLRFGDKNCFNWIEFILFFKIILKNQRWPLPFLLSLSFFFYGQ